MRLRRRVTALEAQAKSRQAIRDAVTGYARLRKASGVHRDNVDVTLADGTKAVALIRVDLIPHPEES